MGGRTGIVAVDMDATGRKRGPASRLTFCPEIPVKQLYN
jgi:hypothetical protein